MQRKTDQIFLKTGIKGVIQEKEFHKRKGLDNIHLSSEIEIIEERAFKDCMNLVNVKFNQGLLEIGDAAFSGCNLKQFYLPHSLKKIGAWAFVKSQLTSLIFHKNLTELGIGSFGQCPSLKFIHFSGGLKLISEKAFTLCTSLKHAHFTEGLEKIDYQAFWGCVKFVNPEFPTTLVEIGREAFMHNIALTELRFEPGLKKIGRQAFHGCLGLERLHFSNGLEEIGIGAFNNCTNIKSIYIDSEDDQYVNFIRSRLPSHLENKIIGTSDWRRLPIAKLAITNSFGNDIGGHILSHLTALSLFKFRPKIKSDVSDGLAKNIGFL